MLQSLKSFFGRSYRPLNVIEVSKSALIDNYNYLSSLNLAVKVAPAIKSNAYGHGIVEVSKILDSLTPPLLCVDSLFEAYQLQKAKIKTPILVMGYVNPKSLRTKKLPFSFAVYTYEQLEAVHKYQPQAGIHIFVDTGMHREGISLVDLEAFVKKAQSLSLTIEGLMSHFGMSDKPINETTKMQIKNFEAAQTICSENNVYPTWVHIANSSGMLNLDSLKGNLGNMARTGIAIYGFDPEEKDSHLKPVLSLKTVLEQIKTVKKGEKIGYDFTYTAKKDIKIGVLPIGYNDGVDRRLSNKGYVQLNGQYSPILGRVSMNVTVIDVSSIEKVEVGQEVTVYSSNSEDKNSIIESAKLCNTIPHDLLVHLISSTKRVIVK